MLARTLFLLGFACLCLAPWAAAEDVKLCPELLMRGEVELNFSETEKRLLCGDEKNAPWADPSESQVKQFIVSFLQSRGYFQPTFGREGTVLVVEIGDKTRIKILRGEGMPAELDFSRFWVPPRKTLTPGLLNEYEDLVRGRIESRGYPCPSVEATADAPERSMTVTAQNGPRLRVKRIDEEQSVDLRPLTLRRYFPLTEGDWYDGDLVFIANERIRSEDILASTYMVSTCEPDGALVQHRAVTGPARRMSVGFGVNTETYFLVRSSYRNARVDANASRFDAVLSANYVKQRIEASFDWYFLATPSAFHFKPRLAFDRQSEKESEAQTTTASWHLGAYRDFWGRYWRVYTGPNLNHVRTFRGEAPDFARILEAEVSGRVLSHAYEFFRGSPRTGHFVDWRYTTASDRTLSTMAVDTFTANGQVLFNTAMLEPPLLVFGIRARVANTDADADVELPDQYLHYLGGSDDVRGFVRRTVPSKEKGARTLVTVGSETRLVTIVPYGIQPFGFLDAGQIGPGGWIFDPTIYYSPGFGVRWQSPIGSLRGSVARGLVRTEDERVAARFQPRLTAFLSFGEEF